MANFDEFDRSSEVNYIKENGQFNFIDWNSQSRKFNQNSQIYWFD